MNRSIGIVLLLLGFAAAALAQSEAELFGSKGIRPELVRQGSLGNCYFYASIAALAGTQPELLRQAIRSNEEGGLSVYFADGKSETVRPEDVQFARKSGFDRSQGLWVSVLFRGYAQRTLRAALIQSVDQSGLPSPLKLFTGRMIDDSDLLLLAYDRAIRSQIDQAGDISRDGLKKQLQVELASVPLLGIWKDDIVEAMDARGFFENLAAQVKANGELFGAYRSAGSGGMPEQVLTAFTGEAHSYRIEARKDSAVTLAHALQNHQAIVAWTRDSDTPAQDKAHSTPGNEAEDWYIPGHAYSVLSVDTDSGTVTMRNPWGNHPMPQGEFTLSMERFSSAYVAFSASASPQNPGGR
jgi:hypothetical protein